MAQNAQTLTETWKVVYPANKEPFNDPNLPAVVTMQLMPGAMIRQGKIVTGLNRTLQYSTLTLRLNLSNWRKSAKYLKCYRERRYPVTCDEAPDVVTLFAGEKGWEVEFKLP